MYDVDLKQCHIYIYIYVCVYVCDNQFLAYAIMRPNVFLVAGIQLYTVVWDTVRRVI